MHLATTEAIRRAAHGESVTQAVSCSLRYDKKRSQLTPALNLGLWKYTVLPHFIQNLHYIQITTDVKKLQTRLNLFRAGALHVCGDHTALLEDTGVSPLDDDCFYYHSWRNNVVIAFGTLSSFLT